MLEVKNLYKSYKVGNKNYPVLQGVDVNIERESLYQLWDLQEVERQHF